MMLFQWPKHKLSSKFNSASARLQDVFETNVYTPKNVKIVKWKSTVDENGNLKPQKLSNSTKYSKRTLSYHFSYNFLLWIWGSVVFK